MDGFDLKSMTDLAKHYPLLTREEERDLSGVFQAGRQAAQELEAGDISPERRAELRKAVWDGELARERFLNSNLRLVITIAKRYGHPSFTLSDLVQEGNIGLIRALEKFDPDRGCKFSTYSSWWVRQSITRAIQYADMIRIPVHRTEARMRLRRAESDVGRGDARDVSDDTIARIAGMPVKDVEVLRSLPQVSASLDDPIGDGLFVLGDKFCDEDAEDAETLAIRANIQDNFDKLFEDFTERDRLIFQMRYGDDKASLDDIGQAFGVTRERIRQIIEKHKKGLRAKAKLLGMV